MMIEKPFPQNNPQLTAACVQNVCGCLLPAAVAIEKSNTSSHSPQDQDCTTHPHAQLDLDRLNP